MKYARWFARVLLTAVAIAFLVLILERVSGEDVPRWFVIITGAISTFAFWED